MRVHSIARSDFFLFDTLDIICTTLPLEGLTIIGCDGFEDIEYVCDVDWIKFETINVMQSRTRMASFHLEK